MDDISLLIWFINQLITGGYHLVLMRSFQKLSVVIRHGAVLGKSRSIMGLFEYVH